MVKMTLLLLAARLIVESNPGPFGLDERLDSLATFPFYAHDANTSCFEAKIFVRKVLYVAQLVALDTPSPTSGL